MSTDDKKPLKTVENKSVYSAEDTCPCCGTYTYDGAVCTACQKKYGIYVEKHIFIEEL